MHNDIGYIHHVGHVVRDIEQAREYYRRLGFLCSAPAYPMLSRSADEPAKPFGAANMHASFTRNFVEIMAVVTQESHLPTDARPIPLQVPPKALPRVVKSIERTIARVSASLARFEGLHILVFETSDVNETAQRFDQMGVGHSGINRIQQPHQLVPMGVIEIDREDVPEGRLAVAESRVSEAVGSQSSSQHPNGALDLTESILCTSNVQIDAYVERYQRYLGRMVRREGVARIFGLQQSCVRLIPSSSLEEFLPGETAPPLPAFVAYAVTVRDLGSTQRWLENSGFDVRPDPSGGIFIPGRAALGAAVIFRQAH